jgi:EmrB/QacA subfamily drug resistance transporter
MASKTAASAPANSYSANGALAGLSVSVLLASLGTSSSNVALPTLALTFEASFQQVQWIVLAYLLAITTLVVSVGRLGDILGRRRFLIGGLLLFTAASIACGLASNLFALIVARAVQGLGAAIMMALAMAFVGEAVSKKKTGSAMGLLGTMSAVGTALGPTLGGVLIDGLGWPAIYFVNAPLGLSAVVLLYRFLPPDVRRPGVGRSSFDYLGTLLLAAMLAAYSLSMTNARDSFGVVSGGLLVVAIVLFGIFVWTETKMKSPLIDPAVFRTPGLGAGFLMSASLTTVVMATLVVGPFYLADGLGLTAASVGLVMSCGPIVAALTGIPAGRIVDRYGAKKVMMTGLITAAAGCAAMASTPAGFGVPGYVLPLAVITAGYAIFQAANNTAVMNGIGSDQRGVVSGMLNLSRNLGLITGASAMGAVFIFGRSLAASTSSPEEAVANGMRLTFWVAALLILASVALAVRAHSLFPRHNSGPSSCTR